ncbi:MAG: hypothetical protein M1834_009740 [Cirrosporium novae-zelandiae]|nr:MAG: hypothetical protein M1834_009740 [Cirrosporium novae-zelandiae]
MHIPSPPTTSLLTILTLLLTSTSALPVNPRTTTTNSTSLSYLKTTLLTSCTANTYCDTSPHDNLYVSSYHTGAGESDATLSSDHGVAGSLINETYWQFEIGEYQWGMNLEIQTFYTSWQPVSILTFSPGTAGMTLSSTTDDSTKYLNPPEPYGGWLVCDWWHASTPQLFYLVDPVGEDTDLVFPDSCTRVLLALEAV